MIFGAYSPLMSPLSFFQGYFTNDIGNFQQYALVPAEISAKVSLPCSLVHAIGFESLSFDSGCRLIYHLNRLASIPLGVASAALGRPIVDKTKYKDKHTERVFGNVHVPRNRALGVSLYNNLTQLVGEGSLKVGS